MMRSVATWVMYAFIPQSEGLVARVLTEPSQGYSISRISTGIIDLLALSSCMALLIFLSCLWRDRVDTLCVKFSMWVEEIMLGKKSLLGSTSGIRLKVDHINAPNGHKRDVELGVKA